MVPRTKNLLSSCRKKFNEYESIVLLNYLIIHDGPTDEILTNVEVDFASLTSLVSSYDREHKSS